MTIEPQPPVQLDPVTVEITGVELVLQLLVSGCPGDPVYLVPAFEFLPGPIGSVPAVTGDSLVGSADPDAPLEPCPGQTEPDMPMGKHEPAPLPARP
jgi:hypothetical protein